MDCWRACSGIPFLKLSGLLVKSLAKPFARQIKEVAGDVGYLRQAYVHRRRIQYTEHVPCAGAFGLGKPRTCAIANFQWSAETAVRRSAVARMSHFTAEGLNHHKFRFVQLKQVRTAYSLFAVSKR